MKFTTIITALCALALSPLALANEPPPETQWVGRFSIGGESTVIGRHERTGAPHAVSGMDVPSRGARDIPLKNFRLEKAGAPRCRL